MKSLAGTLGSVMLMCVILLLTAPSQSYATQPEPVDIFDVYAGLAEAPDMTKCCGCHTRQCYGTNESSTWAPRKTAVRLTPA